MACWADTEERFVDYDPLVINGLPWYWWRSELDGLREERFGKAATFQYGNGSGEPSGHLSRFGHLQEKEKEVLAQRRKFRVREVEDGRCSAMEKASENAKKLRGRGREVRELPRTQGLLQERRNENYQTREPRRNQFWEESSFPEPGVCTPEVTLFLSQMGCPLGLTSFSGVNPRNWISMCEEYFSVNQSLEIFKDSIVADLLVGKAKAWYWSWSLGNEEASWDKFVEALCLHFENEDLYEDAILQDAIVEAVSLDDSCIIVGDSKLGHFEKSVDTSLVDVDTLQQPPSNTETKSVAKVVVVMGNMQLRTDKTMVELIEELEKESKLVKGWDDIKAVTTTSVENDDLIRKMIFAYDPGKLAKGIAKLSEGVAANEVQLYAEDINLSTDGLLHSLKEAISLKDQVNTNDGVIDIDDEDECYIVNDADQYAWVEVPIPWVTGREIPGSVKYSFDTSLLALLSEKHIVPSHALHLIKDWNFWLLTDSCLERQFTSNDGIESVQLSNLKSLLVGLSPLPKDLEVSSSELISLPNSFAAVHFSTIGKICLRLDLTIILEISEKLDYKDDKSVATELLFQIWTNHIREILNSKKKGVVGFQHAEERNAATKLLPWCSDFIDMDVCGQYLYVRLRKSELDIIEKRKSSSEEQAVIIDGSLVIQGWFWVNVLEAVNLFTAILGDFTEYNELFWKLLHDGFVSSYKDTIKALTVVLRTWSQIGFIAEVLLKFENKMRSVARACSRDNNLFKSEKGSDFVLLLVLYFPDEDTLKILTEIAQVLDALYLITFTRLVELLCLRWRC